MACERVSDPQKGKVGRGWSSVHHKHQSLLAKNESQISYLNSSLARSTLASSVHSTTSLSSFPCVYFALF